MARTVGRYRLMEKIDAGGMGEVWAAEDQSLLRRVAVKVITSRTMRDAEATERFLHEARLAAKINHPYVATIYEVGIERDALYIAMELAQGEPLSARIARGAVARRDAIRITRQVAEGLGAAHAQSVIHRDVKPANIMVGRSSVKLIDCGVAHQTPGTHDGTAFGAVTGTPWYVSPEQAMGLPLDARTDVYSLGAVLYEALTGQRPFNEQSVTETLLKIVTGGPADPRTIVEDLPDDLVSIVQTAMAAKREERFSTADELASALVHANFAAERALRAGETAPMVEKRVLIAESDQSTRAVIGEVVRSSGATCDHAATGTEALQMLKEHAYAVAFVDLLLPRIDGWGLLDFIHRHPRRMPRVVVLDGGEQRFSVVDSEVIRAVVHKPVNQVAVEGALIAAAETQNRSPFH